MNVTTVVIATHNRKKAGEMRTILSKPFPQIELKTLADYSGAPDPEETGSSYAENATIKAESAARFTKELCIADDAGLEIDALDGAPGLHSKRFGGEVLPFPEKMAMILEAMKGVPEEMRTARFRCCVAVSFPPSHITHHTSQDHQPSTLDPRPSTRVFESSCEGRIAHSPSGSGGFGYDPIFFLPELNCCMADLTPDQKHAISHRGKVLKLVGDWLEKMTG